MAESQYDVDGLNHGLKTIAEDIASVLAEQPQAVKTTLFEALQSSKAIDKFTDKMSTREWANSALDVRRKFVGFLRGIKGWDMAQ